MASFSIGAFPAATSQSYVLVAVGINSTTIAVSSITGGTGTFVKVAGAISASSSLELWVGYDFGTSYPTSATITRGAGTATMTTVSRTIDVYGDCSQAPSATASTAGTGTGTTADSGSLTPAVGDILFTGLVLASTSADSTAQTHTGNTYLNNTGAELSSVRVECAWCEAAAAVASSESWTIGSTTWAAVQAKWTPPAAPAASTAWVYKGRDLASLDTEGVA